MLLTFSLTMIAFLFIGLWRRSVATSSGSGQIGKESSDLSYYLADRNVTGWVSGISAATSSHSAFMLTGMIGAIFADLVFIWLLVGWFIGAACVWLFYYPKVWRIAQAEDAITLTELISNGIIGKRKTAFYIFVSVAFALLLGFYASAQIIAADATLNVAFGNYSKILVIASFAFIIIYSSYRGIRGTVNSDIAQGLVVLISVAVVTITLMYRTYSQAGTDGYAIFAQFKDLTTIAFNYGPLGGSVAGTIIFILGWIVGGASEIGAPHVMSRVLATKSKRQLRLAARTYLLWFGLLSLSVIFLSVLIKANMTDLGINEETNKLLIYATVAKELLPDWMMGIVTAGFVAATISTADSLIVAAGAVVGYDLRRSTNSHLSIWWRRATTASIGIIAFTFYYLAKDVLALEIDLYDYITLAWALISCVFVPAVLMRLLSRVYSSSSLILSSLLGMVCILFWVLTDLSDIITYELLPSVLLSSMLLFTLSQKNTRA